VINKISCYFTIMISNQFIITSLTIWIIYLVELAETGVVY
jgi:hypothetical protein